MKYLLLMSVLLMHCRVGAQSTNFLGSWKVVENQCSDGSQNRAALPAAIKNNVSIIYSFSESRLAVNIEIRGLNKRVYAIQDCDIQLQSLYRIPAANQTQYFEVMSPVTTCSDLEFQSFAPLARSMIEDTQFVISDDQQFLTLIANNVSGACGAQAQSVTVLMRITN